MTLFEEHPLRHALNEEVHARPSVPLTGPTRISYLAFVHANGSSDREHHHLEQLAQQLGIDLPETGKGHILIDAGDFRLKWERHTEFSSYTFFRDVPDNEPEDTTALLAVPAAWRKAIPGQLLVASHVAVLDARAYPPQQRLEGYRDPSQMWVISRFADNAGWIFTDFRIHDGFSRFTVIDERLDRRQAGRNVQRLLEIETYRLMALLAFPVAKAVGPVLTEAENELADLMDTMGRAQTPDDERDILARLTRLSAQVEQSVARTTYRFGAAAAYYRLVQQRTHELRETRYAGFPSIGDFIERRLAPAVNTCAAIAHRQEELSARVARNSQLLRTRVDIELQQQNQSLLGQMNQRAKLQLRLQETVEGLSVVAITYYASQLVNYLSKGAKPFIKPLTPEIITAVSIPVIAGLVALGLHRMRKHLAAAEAHE
ncbi:DUF3422 domain-containing protein [Nitrogeniibacter mangrovi]|uniref:DUF3422 domain-containing protein n=1 Tax=Nitrogeniibacter mangrovi TaxID=2016596 RepID=A0A6C1B2Q2_9RHOO|nr:DUF3422 domain-containing protein [Nitrogeniibacter mangrovi]QID17165.1 DUF3422 domain-containing protein [Nitrogeniibacter mangrovi]